MAVKSIDPLDIDVPAFSFEQYVDTAVPKAPSLSGKRNNARVQLTVFVIFGLIAQHGSGNVRQPPSSWTRLWQAMKGSKPSFLFT